MRIGHHLIDPPLVLAPMAGVTDKPFRQLCKRFGAGLAVSEMTSADPSLWQTRKSRQRMDHSGEPAPVSVQIAGYDPAMLARAARHNVEQGADIIDINMGCPAKKVCNVSAGSALMRDERLVEAILRAVVAAVPVPVTLKIRTGWSPAERNGPIIARIAEDCGVQALAVHGRSRAEHFQGAAEYQTIAAIKRAVGIPVIANGDIDSPEKAARVLAETGADAVMIGRAAQGRPWIFREIAHYLTNGEHLPVPDRATIGTILCGHLENLYAFYGEPIGLRIARKHLGWYVKTDPLAATFRAAVNPVDSAKAQLQMARDWFAQASDGLTLAQAH